MLPSIMNEFTIHGSRGSVPVSGKSFLKYGGNTTCFSFETDKGILIIDAGTGIIKIADQLAKRSEIPPITILFTHFHHDHVIGLPFFTPLYMKSADITFMGDATREDNWKQNIVDIVGHPYWPMRFNEMPARTRFVDIKKKNSTLNIHGIKVTTCPVWHPQTCLAFRLEAKDFTVVVATDHEIGIPELDKSFLKLCRDADYLIYDAQYTQKEYPHHFGWGHGVWSEAVEIARRTNATELILAHHDRYRTDTQIDKMVKAARKIFPKTRGAREQMALRAPNASRKKPRKRK